jgi:hypothetical protein
MKKPQKKTNKSLVDTMQELGQKYGVKVTDMSERGVRAIGIMGGVRKQDQGPSRSRSADRSKEQGQ